MALEDAMGALKKAFDNDVISLDEYLRTIRTLANKQCKQIVKINKIISATSGSMPQGMNGAPGMQAPPQGMPGMAPPQMG